MKGTGMKIKIYLFLLTFFQVISVFGQDEISTDTTVFLIPQWKKGELHNVKFTAATNRRRAGKTAQYVSAFDASFFVKEADSSGFIVEWEYKKCTLAEGEDNIENYILAGILNTKLACKFSITGKFQELINADEIRVVTNRSIDNLISRSVSDPDMNLQYVAAKQIIGSQLGLETVTLKEINSYHFLFGYEYRLGIVQNKKGKMTNLFGGQPHNGVQKIELSSIDNKKSICVIEMNKTVDNEVLKSQVVAYFKQLAIQTGKQLTANFEQGKLEYSEKVVQHIDFKKSILLKSSFKRIFNIGIEEQATIIDIETID